jgi:hypothetical protein
MGIVQVIDRHDRFDHVAFLVVGDGDVLALDRHNPSRDNIGLPVVELGLIMLDVEDDTGSSQIFSRLLFGNIGFSGDRSHRPFSAGLPVGLA